MCCRLSSAISRHFEPCHLAYMATCAHVSTDTNSRLSTRTYLRLSNTKLYHEYSISVQKFLAVESRQHNPSFYFSHRSLFFTIFIVCNKADIKAHTTSLSPTQPNLSPIAVPNRRAKSHPNFSRPCGQHYSRDHSPIAALSGHIPANVTADITVQS